MRFISGCGLILCMFAAASVADAQAPSIAVPDAPACARCTIGVQRVVTLGDIDGPGSLASVPTVRVDGIGRYWIFAGTELPAVYDTGGRFLRRVGAKDEGPGEYQMPRDGFSIPGDSFVVLDGQLRRGTVVTPDLRATRSFRLPQGFSWVVPVRWPDHTIAYGADVVQSLQRVAFGSESARVMGAFGPTRASRHALPLSLRAARTSDGRGMWSSSVPGYQLQQWTVAGALLKTLTRTPEWFPSASVPSIGWADKPPTPGIADIQQTTDGLLWVFIDVPSPAWRQAWPPMAPGATHVEGSKIGREYLYRTTVEVIDPQAGRVLARRALDEWLVAALPGGRAAAYGVDADGIPRVTVMRLSLHGR